MASSWIDVIPVTSQLKSLVQACKGDRRGARLTQERFSKKCVVVSQVRSASEALVGNRNAALETQLEFAENIDAIPLFSQVKSLAYAVKGDKEAAKRIQQKFSKQCILVSQARSLYELTNGDRDGAKETFEEFLGGDGLVHAAIGAGILLGPFACAAVAGAGTATVAEVAIVGAGVSDFAIAGSAVAGGCIAATSSAAVLEGNPSQSARRICHWLSSSRSSNSEDESLLIPSSSSTADQGPGAPTSPGDDNSAHWDDLSPYLEGEIMERCADDVGESSITFRNVAEEEEVAESLSSPPPNSISSHPIPITAINIHSTTESSSPPGSFILPIRTGIGPPSPATVAASQTAQEISDDENNEYEYVLL